MISQFDAFRLGHRDATRLIRRGFEPAEISPRTAEAMRPRLSVGVGSVGAYLNGWGDGRRGDTFRLEAIAECEAQGLRF